MTIVDGIAKGHFLPGRARSQFVLGVWWSNGILWARSIGRYDPLGVPASGREPIRSDSLVVKLHPLGSLDWSPGRARSRFVLGSGGRMASFGPSRLVAMIRSAYGIRKSNVGNGYGRSAECTAVMYSVGRNEKRAFPAETPQHYHPITSVS